MLCFLLPFFFMPLPSFLFHLVMGSVVPYGVFKLHLDMNPFVWELNFYPLSWCYHMRCQLSQSCEKGLAVLNVLLKFLEQRLER